MNTIFIVLPILTLLMFDLGLTLKPQDFQLIAQRPKPVIVGLVGQIILLPLIAWLIIHSPFAIHLSPLFIIGIMLVACSPGGSSSNVFSMLAKGDVALSVTLTACSSIITLFTLPLIMAWAMKSVQFSDVSIRLPIGNLLIQNLVLMVVPIAIGFVVNIFREQAAAKIHNVLRRIAMPALILLVTVFFFQHKQTIVAQFASLGLTMTVLIRSVARMALTSNLQRTSYTRHRDRYAECRTSHHYSLQPADLQQRDHRHTCYHLCPNDEPHPAGVCRSHIVNC